MGLSNHLKIKQAYRLDEIACSLIPFFKQNLTIKFYNQIK